ncbi:hypothetical protein BaRGS_00019044 [Batillaria attramentaria]|uniref:Uncharacterized protein n=1 Tax=Batillaria attramentaria TaxID=370345 RepID=A0ABD0KR45_9CAEN
MPSAPRLVECLLVIRQVIRITKSKSPCFTSICLSTAATVSRQGTDPLPLTMDHGCDVRDTLPLRIYCKCPKAQVQKHLSGRVTLGRQEWREMTSGTVDEQRSQPALLVITPRWIGRLL